MGIKLLLCLPFFEIILFILFGDLFGFFNALIIIFITGIIGLWLLFPRVTNIEKNLHKPLQWLCKRLAGIFLLIPGFFTDFFGLILLVKPLRGLVWSFLPAEIKNFSNKFNAKTSKNKSKTEKKIIEGDFRDLDD